jgi:hypothetical protein
MWGRAVDEPRVTPSRPGGDRALALDEQKVSPALAALDDEPLGRPPAMKVAMTASTEIPQPAIAMPVWPVGTNLEAMPRARASRSSSSEDRHLPDRAVRADGEDDLAGHLEIRPLGTSRSSGGRRRSVSVAPDARASGASSGSSRRNWCRPFSIPIPFGTQSRRISARPAGTGRPACRDTDERHGRCERQRSGDVGDDRHAPARPPPASSRGSRRRPRGGSAAPAHGLAVVRVVREALGEDQQPAAQLPTPRPGSSEGSWHAVDERDAGTRVLGEQRGCRRESTWSQSGGRRRSRGDADARLDHAAEHHAPRSRARGSVRHADRLADARPTWRA